MFGLLEVIVDEIENTVSDAVGSVDDLLEGEIGTRRQIKTGVRIGGALLLGELLGDD